MVISDIFSHLIELTSNVANAYSTVLYSADREEETFYLRDHFTLNSALVPKAKLPFGKGPIAQAVADGKPFVFDYFDAAAANLDVYRKNDDLKSFLIVPVVYRDLEGVLVITAKETYSFTPKLQKIVGGFADQMAWHLSQEKQHANQCGQAWPSIRKMNTFIRFLAESSDRAALAKRLLEIPASILDCDAVAVVVFSGSNTGKVQEQRGFSQNFSHHTVHLGAGIAGACAQSRSPILSRSFDNTLMTLFSEKEEPESLKSVAAVPITQGANLLGVLVCGSLEMEGLAQPDLDKLVLIAFAASSSIYAAETKDKGVNDKNRDPVTGTYNHRFLVQYHQTVAQKIANETTPVFFLTLQLTNLVSIYETYGMARGDMLLRGIVSLCSKMIPSPKNIFKYSDNSFIIMILKMDREAVEALESKLKKLFDNKPFSVDGTPVRVKADWGLSSFPDDGKNVLDLISLSWARTSKQMKVTL